MTWVLSVNKNMHNPPSHWPRVCISTTQTYFVLHSHRWWVVFTASVYYNGPIWISQQEKHGCPWVFLYKHNAGFPVAVVFVELHQAKTKFPTYTNTGLNPKKLSKVESGTKVGKHFACMVAGLLTCICVVVRLMFHETNGKWKILKTEKMIN